MAYIRTKLRHYNGNRWDTVYVETGANIVIRNNGVTVEDSFIGLETDVANNNNNVIDLYENFNTLRDDINDELADIRDNTGSDLSGIRNSISTMQSNINNNKTDIINATTDITEIKERVNVLENEFWYEELS